MSETVQVEVRQAPGRCAYCHGDVPSVERVACTECLAPHHQDCFHASCAACGSTGVLVRGSSGAEPDAEARKWGMLCHAAAFAGFVFPFGNVLGPLIAWKTKKHLHPFVDAQGRESINFHLTMLIVHVLAILIFVASVVGSAVLETPVLVFIGLPLLLLTALGLLASWIATGFGAARANDGKSFRYPFAIRFLATPEATLAPPRGRERADPKTVDGRSE